MKLKKVNLIFAIAFFMCMMLNACSESNGLYIDINKGAIVSCNGHGMKKIRVESDSGSVTFEGTDPVIYFNKKNAVAITRIYGEIVYDYKFKLKSNCEYTVTKDMGYDRGNFTLTFETNSSGKVIKASDENCD